MNNAEKTVISELFKLQDEKYRDFQIRLIPNIPAENIIGVRTPDLRLYAKEFHKSGLADEFISSLPHTYYEENGVHSFLIEYINDYDKTVVALDAFLPYVDNWATCDSMSPKVFSKHKDRLYGQIKKWICDTHTYTVRFGIKMLMAHFLDSDFTEETLQLICGVQSDEYYINMMRAWFFATALAKQYESTVPYIENASLDLWTHNKSIQKAVESYRITENQKTYLRTLRR